MMKSISWRKGGRTEGGLDEEEAREREWGVSISFWELMSK